MNTIWSGVQPRPVPMRRIVPATTAHVPAIIHLVNEHARRGDLLPRSAQSIVDSLPDWLVGLRDGEVVACGSLFHYNGTLAEVRSLAVADTAKGQGWGSEIVRRLLELAAERNVPTVFTLTRAVRFFARLGFGLSDRQLFPLKVWKDCQICPLQDHCDETAMALAWSAETATWTQLPVAAAGAPGAFPALPDTQPAEVRPDFDGDAPRYH